MKKYNIFAAVFIATCFFGANAMKNDGTDPKKNGSDKINNARDSLRDLGAEVRALSNALNKPAPAAKPWHKELTGSITSGIKETPKDCVKATITDTYKAVILNPYIINPIKGLFESKSSKIQRETDEIIKSAEQIDKAKKAGVNNSYISKLKAMLTAKIQGSVLGSNKGKK